MGDPQASGIIYERGHRFPLSRLFQRPRLSRRGGRAYTGDQRNAGRGVQKRPHHRVSLPQRQGHRQRGQSDGQRRCPRLFMAELLQRQRIRQLLVQRGQEHQPLRKSARHRAFRFGDGERNPSDRARQPVAERASMAHGHERHARRFPLDGMERSGYDAIQSRRNHERLRRTARKFVVEHELSRQPDAGKEIFVPRARLGPRGAG